jgi:nitrate/nitrite-specific signal transduction histidine kinase
MSGDDSIPKPQAAQEFLHMLHRGADFLREVVEDNERLRLRVAGLEASLQGAGGAAPQSGDADERVRRLEEELASWRSRYDELYGRVSTVEEENQSFLSRYLQVEEENNNLANLYIASYQLHSTLNFREVLQIILEIVINLVGAELFAVYLLDQHDEVLSPVAAEGLDIERFPAVKLGEGEIGAAIAARELALYEDRLGERNLDPTRPLAVIPLKIKDDLIGAIVVHQLLSQKPRFADVDRELFNLLGGHAATAIFASKLYTESERKLSTMQGFIQLLTK